MQVVCLALVLVFFAAVSNACPDLAALRSDFVKSSKFSLSKLAGLWYEVAYHDLAQVGEKCQTYDKGNFQNATRTHVAGVPEKFAFAYFDKSSPSSMKLFYETTDQVGVFKRFLDAPLADQMKFPSVIVDVTSSDDYATYDSITEYLCYSLAGIEYEEVRVGARLPAMDAAKLQTIEDSLVSAGVTCKVSLADQSDCVYTKA